MRSLEPKAPDEIFLTSPQPCADRQTRKLSGDLRVGAAVLLYTFASCSAMWGAAGTGSEAAREQNKLTASTTYVAGCDHVPLVAEISGAGSVDVRWKFAGGPTLSGNPAMLDTELLEKRRYTVTLEAENDFGFDDATLFVEKADPIFLGEPSCQRLGTFGTEIACSASARGAREVRFRWGGRSYDRLDRYLSCRSTETYLSDLRGLRCRDQDPRMHRAEQNASAPRRSRWGSRDTRSLRSDRVREFFRMSVSTRSVDSVPNRVRRRRFLARRLEQRRPSRRVSRPSADEPRLPRTRMVPTPPDSHR